jgi:predicted secreted protein
MSEHASSSDQLSPESAGRFRRQVEGLIRTRIENVARLESFRSQARDSNLPAVEEFFFQVQQADQRIIQQAEQFLGGLLSENAEPRRDRMIDHEIAESFPASDPPTYSRIT